MVINMESAIPNRRTSTEFMTGLVMSSEQLFLELEPICLTSIWLAADLV